MSNRVSLYRACIGSIETAQSSVCRLLESKIYIEGLCWNSRINSVDIHRIQDLSLVLVFQGKHFFPSGFAIEYDREWSLTENKMYNFILLVLYFLVDLV